jgi:O-antigen/teichoic acid export membrane protein
LELPSGLYIGGLMGLQAQVRANTIQIGWGLFRGLGAVLVLWLVSPTVYAFASWQLLSNVIYCLVARMALWRVLRSFPGQAHPRFEWRVFHTTWRFAAGMLGMSVISTLLTQTDKLLVSKMLPLQMLGYYTLAGAVGSVPATLAGPIATAVFPRLTALVASESSDGLTSLYHRTCQLVAIAVVPAGLTVALFARECIFAWTGSALLAERAALVASLLVGGQIIQALLVVPYYLALAHGYVRLNLQIGIASVVLILPLLIGLVVKYGIVGAGLSWLVMNLCTVPSYMYLLHRRILPGEFRRWLLRDVLRPLCGAFPAVLLARLFAPMPTSRMLAIALIALVWGVSAGSAVLLNWEVVSFWPKKRNNPIYSAP